MLCVSMCVYRFIAFKLMAKRGWGGGGGGGVHCLFLSKVHVRFWCIALAMIYMCTKCLVALKGTCAVMTVQK